MLRGLCRAVVTRDDLILDVRSKPCNTRHLSPLAARRGAKAHPHLPGLHQGSRATRPLYRGASPSRNTAVSYAIKEIFLTLQGEGAHSGRAAVFCRFAGCNLWSGREADRASAQCRFCDTDFVGTDGTLGGRYASADALADIIAGQWTGTGESRYAVLTG